MLIQSTGWQVSTDNLYHTLFCALAIRFHATVYQFGDLPCVPDLKVRRGDLLFLRQGVKCDWISAQSHLCSRFVGSASENTFLTSFNSLAAVTCKKLSCRPALRYLHHSFHCALHATFKQVVGFEFSLFFWIALVFCHILLNRKSFLFLWHKLDWPCVKVCIFLHPAIYGFHTKFCCSFHSLFMFVASSKTIR
jgi:hypothetical protein